MAWLPVVSWDRTKHCHISAELPLTSDQKQDRKEENYDNYFKFLLNVVWISPTLSKRQERHQRWATVGSTTNCHGRECRRAGQACYSRWPRYLKSLKSVIFHMVQFTELFMKNSVWKRCVQNGYPNSWQEHNKWRVICAKQMLSMFEPQGPKRLTDVVTGDETL